MLKSKRAMRWLLAIACLAVGTIFGFCAIALGVGFEYLGAPETPRNLAAYWTFIIYGLGIFGFGCKEAVKLYREATTSF